jgi:centromeric protein E
VVTDLLDPSNTSLKIHEQRDQVFVGGLTEKIVVSPEEMMQYMREGMGLSSLSAFVVHSNIPHFDIHTHSLTLPGQINRHIGSTKMNERSSRSHTIFRIMIESREVAYSDEGDRVSMDGAVRVAQLNLVDLAGSERADQTGYPMNFRARIDFYDLSGAENVRLKEGGSINKSLLFLGTVISLLSDGQAGQHIPYRNSKLTRILQNSLGGNARTAIICTITPAGAYVEESSSTLKFASRAKSIRNNAVVNEIASDDTLLKRYRNEINELKRQKDLLESGSHVQELTKEKNMLAEEVRLRAQQLKEKESEIEKLTRLICVSSSSAVKPFEHVAAEERVKILRRGTWCPGLSSSKASSRRSIEPLPKRKLVEIEPQGFAVDVQRSSQEEGRMYTAAAQPVVTSDDVLQQEMDTLQKVC